MLRQGYQVTADFESTHWWFTSRRKLILQQTRRAAMELGFPQQRLKLLDFGCGTGFNLPFLSEFGSVHGADIGGPELADFQKAEHFSRIDLTVATSQYHGHFHIVTALDVLEHIEDDVTGLQEMKRFLVPNGQLILTVPAYRFLWSGEDVISQHKRRYTKTHLLQRCRSAGLEIEFASYYNLGILPAVALVTWGHRLLDPNWQHRSNLSATPIWLNQFIDRILSLEMTWVGSQRGRLPAGASLICRLKPVKDIV